MLIPILIGVYLAGSTLTSIIVSLLYLMSPTLLKDEWTPGEWAKVLFATIIWPITLVYILFSFWRNGR